jgi:lipopolysaccharide biosynthesis protein
MKTGLGDESELAISLFGYHPDILDDILSRIIYLQTPYTLHLGLTEKIYKQYYNSINTKNSVYYYSYKNFGADIQCFLDHLNYIDQKYFIKIHTKKTYLYNKLNWLDILLDGLIDDINIQKNIMSMNYNPKIGIISNAMCVIDNLEHTNQEKIQSLCEGLNINYNTLTNKRFVSGNIFMSKTELFHKYFDSKTIKLLLNLLSKETNKVSDKQHGTFSHSLERIFGYIVETNGLEFLDASHNILTIKDLSNNTQQIIIINNKCYEYNNITNYNHNTDVGEILDKNQCNITICWNDNKIQKYYIENQ